ncbi:4Fe-4S ferredoxin [Ancylothrix sp. C2]|uniref:Light dependent period protein LdpA domain-containing protein n=1 Tax=Ancylothrix sp. D3o TaxID=2953691 RepID=UPI0021BA5A2E|nr:LdpA C-terminal domain-containing domain [Ancylothrix sp. D3o]MCT7949189.1 4Fe-4S ferredoxin [Ancylothrix sp. D3o]
MNDFYSPLNSLQQGHWFKLICGASFQHLPAVRNLTLAYALAGADCIDVAADPAVIASAKEALQTANQLAPKAQSRGFKPNPSPLLMVSLNDGEDPHFRKAEFNPNLCPADCPRPCESICPANAIVFNQQQSKVGSRRSPGGSSTFKPPTFQLDKPAPTDKLPAYSGVLDERCYGCGRCVPLCPIGHISTRSYVFTPSALVPVVFSALPDAIEIHTQIGRTEDFQRLWNSIAPWVGQLKLIAISCPDGEGMLEYLRLLLDIIEPLPCPLIWQTDGRPMSGDIGTGATRAAVKLGQKVLNAGLPGYVQLAGGTNAHTVEKLKSTGLLKPTSDGKRYIAGVAYGSYARVLLAPVLEQLDQTNPQNATPRLENRPDLLWQAVRDADSLVSQLKSPHLAQLGTG